MAAKRAVEFIDDVCQSVDENDEEDSSDGQRMVGKPPCSEPIEPATSSKHVDSDSDYQPSSEGESDAESEEIFEPTADATIELVEDGANLPVKIPSQWKSPKPENWKKNQLKKARSSGQAFVDEKGIEKPAKVPKVPENHSHKEPTHYKCCSFNDEEKKQICSEYWARSDYVAKKNFILKFTKSAMAKRRRIDGDNFRKAMFYEYFLPKGSENLKVQKYFIVQYLSELWFSNK